MYYRAIRGATSVRQNSSEEILEETKRLVNQMLAENEVKTDDIISIFFTATPDLDAVFPAKAARELGLLDTPLICAQELNVLGALTRCIRILMHVNSKKTKQELKHIYLNEAVSLRVDA